MSNQNPAPGGLPLRALAMVLIAVAIVFAGLGAMSLTQSQADSSASSDSATTTSAQAATTSAQAAAASTSHSASSSAAATTTTTTTTTAAGAVDKSIPVRVLNNSTVAGLAAKTKTKLTANGWNVTGTGNYASGVLSKTTVFYENSPHQQATAQAIASQLGGIAQPRTSALSGSAPGIIVIVTDG
ncbi:LytR C-terminal domain-containing protein [Nocardia miyunensis]|uniref:LytR C-terminal domain-containing protein n=1 Tax=Nocardia miyunensis TaxID=282684 RepID=UPI000ABC9917|nr:LytR C-terminal domain-containing protein [Nocardia miyunensis]